MPRSLFSEKYFKDFGVAFDVFLYALDAGINLSIK
jgi:hypothetical protein